MYVYIHTAIYIYIIIYDIVYTVSQHHMVTLHIVNVYVCTHTDLYIRYCIHTNKTRTLQTQSKHNTWCFSKVAPEPTKVADSFFIVIKHPLRIPSTLLSI